MSGVNLEFELLNRLKELDRLNRKLDQFRLQAGIDDKCFAEICLALEELFSNIVRHGHKDSSAHNVFFDISLDGKALTINIVDDGIPFDPNAVPQPDTKCDLEQRKIGGLGIYLVKSVMDEIRYVRCNGKNMTTLKKNIGEACLNKGGQAS